MVDSEQGNGQDNGQDNGESRGNEDLLPLFGGIALGMALIGIVWAVVAFATGGSGEGPEVGSEEWDGASAPALAQPTVSTGPTEPDAAERCRDAVDLLEAPLAEADPAMSQWQVHVGAMNKLVVGEITLAQASAFWNQTRVGAHRRIENFDEASEQLEREGVDCPAPDLLGSESTGALRACSRQVQADVAVLGVARTAVTTWRHHVRDMDRLKLGKISPDDATRMWLSMWERGQRELEAYRIAVRAAERGPGCGIGAFALEPTEPTETTEPTVSPDPSETTDPTDPSDTADPSETTDPTDPTESADPMDPMESMDSMDSMH
ncbi:MULTISPECIES: hypothetical protein [unclassified Nocardioides]|uniref:hypothetical protein n=1 Tax=unclassified Nocardioides TaxID=2615069 RepID=UPI003613B36C